MSRKVLDFIKKDGVYMFVYNKQDIGLLVEYPINGTTIYVNGKTRKIKKPFENIQKFGKYCVETKDF